MFNRSYYGSSNGGFYHTCPNCGANLDPEEFCTCCEALEELGILRKEVRNDERISNSRN